MKKLSPYLIVLAIIAWSAILIGSVIQSPTIVGTPIILGVTTNTTTGTGPIMFGSNPTTTGTLSSSNISVTGTLTNSALSTSSVVITNASKTLSSVANTTGWLHNDGAGSFTYTQPDSDHVTYYPQIGTPTHIVNLTDWIHHFGSSASAEGGALTDNGNGSVTIANGEILIRSTASIHDHGIYSATFTGGTLTLTDHATNHIVVKYNAGSPQVFLSSTMANGLDEVDLYMAVRNGNEISYIDFRDETLDYANKDSNRLIDSGPLRNSAGGCLLYNPGVALNIAVTDCKLYYGVNPLLVSATDTSSGTGVTHSMRTAYRIASSWTYTDNVTTIDNVFYNTTSTGLTTLTNNKYVDQWFYMVPNTPSRLYMVYGDAQYTQLADARVGSPPSTLPPEVVALGILIGRVIVQKSAAAPASVDSSFGATFTPSGAVTHNGLAGIQGGNATVPNYYHSNQGINTTDSPSFTGLTVTNTINGSITGNSATATKLSTARAINGTNFDGTAPITVTAAADTLTGTAITSKTINGVTVSPSTGTLSLASTSSLITSGAYSTTLTSTGTTNATLPVGTHTLARTDDPVFTDTSEVISDTRALGGLRTGSATPNSSSAYIAYRSRGTVASPTAVASGDSIGTYSMQGYDGSAWQNSGAIETIINGSVSSGVLPADMVFYVNLTNALVEAMRLTKNKDLVLAGKINNIAITSPATAATITVQDGKTLYYEEGTFSPTVAAGYTISGTPTYTGRYTRIGRRYFCEIHITVSGGSIAGAGLGADAFTGFPGSALGRGLLSMTNDANNPTISGVGMVQTTYAYTPPFAATSDVYINFEYDT